MFGPLRIGNLEGMFLFALFGESDFGFKKNPAKWRYVTLRFFITIVWTFENLKFRGYVFLCFVG